jgi:ATP-dependent protease ClpP protease subunit
MRNDYDWDWENAIFVNGDISDDLVTALAPEILRLKQKRPQAITVGIDSNGGSISAASRLLDLLKAPDTKGEVATVVTVAINKAFSAAATLLALGDYAVALPSAQIHYHDVRFSTYYDLTSSKATEAARALRRENDRVALSLAHSVVERITWIFIDLKKTFPEAKKEFPNVEASVRELGLADLSNGDIPQLDLAGLICAQYKASSAEGQKVLGTAMERLQAWRKLQLSNTEFSNLNRPDADSAALFRDDNPMLSVVNSTLPAGRKFTWSGRTELRSDLVLLFLLLFRDAANDPALRLTEETLADLMTDFAFFNEIRQEAHVDKTVDLVISDDNILFGTKILRAAKEMEEGARKKYWAGVYPQIQTYWAYVVLLCRTLFDGEHPISLDDALFLGLIDEISGRKFPEPRRYVREARVKRLNSYAEEAARPMRKWPRPKRSGN